MASTPFTELELEYLHGQRLGRLATVDEHGAPQNNPVGFFVRADGTIDIGGARMGATRKFRNVAKNDHVSFVVDDLKSVSPWRVRGIEIRGHAEALTHVEPPSRGYSGEIIRIHPTRIYSWGLDAEHPRLQRRTVGT